MVIKKVYETPKTPYQRLMEAKDIADILKRYLTEVFNSLNLVELKKKQMELVNGLFELKTNKKDYLKRLNCEVYA